MDPKQFEVALHDAEVKLKRLKALYEQYFQGIERLEPSVPRKDLERTFQRLHKGKPRNTAARFKLNTLQARYNTYTAYWQRISRQIEEGTYARDLRRARQRRRPAGAEKEEAVKTFELGQEAAVGDEELSSLLQVLGREARQPPKGKDRLGPVPVQTVVDPLPPLQVEDTAPNLHNPFAKPRTATFGKPKMDPPPSQATADPPVTPRAAPPPKPAPPTARTRPGPPPPPPRRGPPPPPRPSGDPMRRLYDDFVAARRQNNQGGKLSYDKLAARVEKMRAKLRQKHGDKNIDFQVVVKDGRVGLKPKIR